MTDLDQHKHHYSSWTTAVLSGVAVFILVFFLLFMAQGILSPVIADPQPSDPRSVYVLYNTLSLIAIWLASISLGIWQVVSHRPRK